MIDIQEVGEQELCRQIVLLLLCGHELRLSLTNARVRLAVAVIWWMCLCHVRSLII